MNLKAKKEYKLYQSKQWMFQKLCRDRLTPEEIAKICGVNIKTIYEYIKKHGILR